MCCYYRYAIRPMMAKNAKNAHVSSLYFSTVLYFCFSLIAVLYLICLGKTTVITA